MSLNQAAAAAAGENTPFCSLLKCKIVSSPVVKHMHFSYACKQLYCHMLWWTTSCREQVDILCITLYRTNLAMHAYLNVDA